MFVGVIEFDLLLGDVASLKQKRAVIRPIMAALRRLDVAVSEVRDHDLYRRAGIAAATVSPDASRTRQVLDHCEKVVCGFGEVELLSARQRLFGQHDQEAGT